MRSRVGSVPKDRTIRHARLLLGAGALLALLVVPVAVAATEDSSTGVQATASGVKGKVKKLSKRVKALEDRLAALQGEQGGARPPSGPAGGDLTGNYPNPAIADGAVNSAKVADNSLTGADILDGGIGLADLADDSVNSTKVVDESLTGDDVQDGSLVGADVANSTLTGAHIVNGSITSADTDASIQDSCALGTVRGHALVNGDDPGIGGTYGATGIVERFNCVGSPPLVREIAAGRFAVCFPNNFPAVAMVSAINSAADGQDNIVSWGRLVDANCPGGTATEVRVVDRDAGALEDNKFSILLLGPFLG